MILLTLKYWRELAIVVLVLIAVTLWEKHNTALVAMGQAQERARIADSTLAAVRPKLATTDTLLVRDTVRVTRTLARLDTLRDSIVAHTTDTLIVKEYVAAVDSARQSCADLQASCVAFRAYATTTIDALTQKLQAQPIAMPRSCTGPSIVWSVIGAGVGFGIGRKH